MGSDVLEGAAKHLLFSCVVAPHDGADLTLMPEIDTAYFDGERFREETREPHLHGAIAPIATRDFLRATLHQKQVGPQVVDERRQVPKAEVTLVDMGRVYRTDHVHS